jgi:hypothetical protein
MSNQFFYKIFKKSLGNIFLSAVDIGKIKVVWIEIDTWIIEKMVLEEGAGSGDGTRGKKVVRCGGCR